MRPDGWDSSSTSDEPMSHITRRFMRTVQCLKQRPAVRRHISSNSPPTYDL